MCVAEELVCDGVIHCPPTTSATLATPTDEDEAMCKERKVLTHSSWEKIAAEFFKKFTGKSKPSLIPAINNDDEIGWFRKDNNKDNGEQEDDKRTSGRIRNDDRQGTKLFFVLSLKNLCVCYFLSLILEIFSGLF